VQLLESATDTCRSSSGYIPTYWEGLEKNLKAGFGIESWFSILVKNFASSLILIFARKLEPKILCF
jgi:hypothetical protein